MQHRESQGIQFLQAHINSQRFLLVIDSPTYCNQLSFLYRVIMRASSHACLGLHCADVPRRVHLALTTRASISASEEGTFGPVVVATVRGQEDARWCRVGAQRGWPAGVAPHCKLLATSTKWERRRAEATTNRPTRGFVLGRSSSVLTRRPKPAG